MKVIVVGGTGLIGSKLITLLNIEGNTTVSASPSNGINSVTGEGLDQAFKGADIVIDVTNSPSFEDNAVLDFFKTSTNNIILAATKANVKHYIALSIVGTERLQDSGYFRAKLLQENLIKESTIPFTILRATQFFEFITSIADVATSDQTIKLTSAELQPVAAIDVAKTLAKLTNKKPANKIIEVAGPEKIGLDTLVRKVLSANSDQRKVITDDSAPYFGTLQINSDSLTPDDGSTIGNIRYDDWLKEAVV
jgi:uncharacterized protein YbjT (DUF2867 family)